MFIARPPVRVPVKLNVVVLCPRPVATVGRQSDVPVGQPPPGVQGDGQLPGRRLHRLRHRGGESVSQSVSREVVVITVESQQPPLPGCGKGGVAPSSSLSEGLHHHWSCDAV